MCQNGRNARSQSDRFDEPFFLQEISLLGTLPNSGILPEGNYLPCSENPSPPSCSHDFGNRPPDTRYFVAIPKTDGRECFHGHERPIFIGAEEKDSGSYGLEEFCPGTF